MQRLLKRPRFVALALAGAVALAWVAGTTTGTQAQGAAVQIDSDDIGGVVQGPNGPEAGVWVIAETDELQTGFVRSVVTDDQGHFVVPDLPSASFEVWVRGYGLADSAKVTARPGSTLTLQARTAASPQEAAQVYPANYWYSLLEVPAASEFPGTGPRGNGIAEGMQTQEDWIASVKQGCSYCHQVGNKATREIQNIDQFDSSVAAWDRRVQSSQRGASMSNRMSRFGRQRALQMFADWTDRISAGAVPPAPPRPAGEERNVVVTVFDWAQEVDYVHDEISTDKRNPRVNSDGKIYGVAISNDYLSVLDPTTRVATEIPLPLRDDRSTMEPMFPPTMPAPSMYYGDDILWDNPANPHTNMMDHKSRVWITHQIRPEDNPAWCKEGSSHPSAQYYPLELSGRHASYYDPASGEFALIDTCFRTHHLVFAENEDHTLWFSGGGDVMGWINTRLYDETGDEQASQAWCPLVLDTNADGQITRPWNDPGGRARATEDMSTEGSDETAIDPTRDTRIRGGAYGIAADPHDTNVVWFSSGGVPGHIMRLDVGDNPPETCMAEVYFPPMDRGAYGPRGMDIDRNGVVWTALGSSGHFASFDRSKCATLNGPTATGNHCPEGWELYTMPGPQLGGVDAPGSAAFSYYNWVDQFNTFGLGENTPIAAGSNSDSLLALKPGTDEWVVLRVPYPMGFHTRGLDGRIDDPEAGWKGKGLWSTNATAANYHTEGGRGTKPMLIKFQLRPDPLAH